MSKTSHLSRRKFLGTSAAASGLMLAAPNIARAAGLPRAQHFSDHSRPAKAAGQTGTSAPLPAYGKTSWAPISSPVSSLGLRAVWGTRFTWARTKPDAYSLIFGNMGPEVLNWAMQAPTFDVNDYFYFGRVDTDPCCLVRRGRKQAADAGRHHCRGQEKEAERGHQPHGAPRVHRAFG